MPTTFSFKTYIPEIRNIDTVFKQLEDLDQELQNSDLKNLRAFNIVYSILLHNVINNVGENFFHDDYVLNQFYIDYSKKYFEALHNYVQNKKISKPWKVCFEECRKDKSWAFVYMALGMNAHVNYDLTLTLNEIIKDASFKDDYDKVDGIIINSIKEVIDSLHDLTKVPRGEEDKKLKITYSIFLNIILHRWRDDAWKNFINLRKELIDVKDIDKNGEKIANKLAGIFHFSELAGFEFPKIRLFKIK